VKKILELTYVPVILIGIFSFIGSIFVLKSVISQIFDSSGWGIVIAVIFTPLWLPIVFFVLFSIIFFLKAVFTRKKEPDLQKVSLTITKSLHTIGLVACLVLSLIFMTILLYSNYSKPNNNLPLIDSKTIPTDGLKISEFEIKETSTGQYEFSVPEIHASIFIDKNQINLKNPSFEAYKYSDGSTSLIVYKKDGDTIIVTTGSIVPFPGNLFYDTIKSVKSDKSMACGNPKNCLTSGIVTYFNEYKFTDGSKANFIVRYTEIGTGQYVVIKESNRLRIPFIDDRGFFSENSNFREKTDKIMNSINLPPISNIEGLKSTEYNNSINDKSTFTDASFPALNLFFSYPKAWGNVSVKTKAIPQIYQSAFAYENIAAPDTVIDLFYFSAISSDVPLIVVGSRSAQLFNYLKEDASLSVFSRVPYQSDNYVLRENKNGISYRSFQIKGQNDLTIINGNFPEDSNILLGYGPLMEFYAKKYNYSGFVLTQIVQQRIEKLFSTIKEIEADTNQKKIGLTALNKQPYAVAYSVITDTDSSSVWLMEQKGQTSKWVRTLEISRAARVASPAIITGDMLYLNIRESDSFGKGGTKIAVINLRSKEMKIFPISGYILNLLPIGGHIFKPSLYAYKIKDEGCLNAADYRTNCYAEIAMIGYNRETTEIERYIADSPAGSELIAFDAEDGKVFIRNNIFQNDCIQSSFYSYDWKKTSTKDLLSVSDCNNNSEVFDSKVSDFLNTLKSKATNVLAESKTSVVGYVSRDEYSSNNVPFEIGQYPVTNNEKAAIILINDIEY